jgi:hypothetical protein
MANTRMLINEEKKKKFIKDLVFRFDMFLILLKTRIKDLRKKYFRKSKEDWPLFI